MGSGSSPRILFLNGYPKNTKKAEHTSETNRQRNNIIPIHLGHSTLTDA